MKKAHVATKSIPKPVRKPGDIFERMNVLDAESYDATEDLSRIRVRVQINRQRLEYVKMAVRAGVLTGDHLRLTA